MHESKVALHGKLNGKMRVLLIAPAAPPKNSPESMQVGRILSCFNPGLEVCLVTTPVSRGWEWCDQSLSLATGVNHTITINLPFHHLVYRLLSSRFFSKIHVPDSDFWITYCSTLVMKQLPWKPDVIYSRSSPFSAAVLACRLKDRLSVPWLMHMSDPWVDSTYRTNGRLSSMINQRLEKKCFASADLVTLTTQRQVDFYAAKYQTRSDYFDCTPNVADPLTSVVARPTVRSSQSHRPIRFLYTGAFYGKRLPDGLLNAVRIIIADHPTLLSKLEFIFVGNAEPSVRELINQIPCCHHLGVLSYSQCVELQQSADILVTIEAQGLNPLCSAFLPSKVVDYLSSNRPILSIGQLDSITADYCKLGFGWSFSSDDTSGIVDCIVTIVTNPDLIASYRLPKLPDEINPHYVTSKIELLLGKIISNYNSTVN